MCPNVTGTELVYDGLTAGTHFSNSGGGANYICVANGTDAEYYPQATTPENMKQEADLLMICITTTFPVLCVRSPLAPSRS